VINENKLFIIENYKDKQRLLNYQQIEELKKSNNINPEFELNFVNFKSNSLNCGDEITFLIWKKNNKIFKINFSNEDCCLIAGSAANIACSYVEKISYKEIGEMLINIECMLNNEFYNEKKVKNFKVFSNLSNFLNRKECINIAIEFMKKVFNHEL
jgi:NifU-like protein involved in Fe-S cluster formation